MNKWVHEEEVEQLLDLADKTSIETAKKHIKFRAIKPSRIIELMEDTGEEKR